MPGFPWISLTTDYGLMDGFVAACHGVIARLAPAVRVIDVTHQIPPGDVRRGAAVLAQTLPQLPPAVHVAVVDPGVGTARRAIAIRAGDGVLVGPDNGLLPWAAEALGGIDEVVEVTRREWFAPVVSATFHGRDIFAPAAARLALGTEMRQAGALIDPADLVRLPEPVVRRGTGWLTAEVLTIDRFGNVQLAASAAELDSLARRLRVGELPAVRAATFGAVDPGTLVVFADSAGKAAIAVNGGRAADVLGLAPGDLLQVMNAD